MKIFPMNENIVVRPIKQETKSGFMLTENNTNDTYIALVIACHPNCCVKEGDQILFSKYNKAVEVKINDEIHYVINNKDIMAIVKN